MPPPIPENSGLPRVGLPHSSVIAQLALIRPLTVSSFAKSTTPATTSIISSSTSELPPLKIQPTKKAYTEDHDFEDLSSVNNRVSSGTPSVAQYLTDEEMDLVASL